MLDLLLEPVTVALPAGMRSPVGSDLRAGLGAVFGGAMPSRPALALDVERPVRITRHDWRRAAVDLPAYAASGLPSETMGRGLAQDPLFFGAALAGGSALAELAARVGSERARRSRRRGAGATWQTPRTRTRLGTEAPRPRERLNGCLQRQGAAPRGAKLKMTSAAIAPPRRASAIER